MTYTRDEKKQFIEANPSLTADQSNVVKPGFFDVNNYNKVSAY